MVPVEVSSKTPSLSTIKEAGIGGRFFWGPERVELCRPFGKGLFDS